MIRTRSEEQCLSEKKRVSLLLCGFFAILALGMRVENNTTLPNAKNPPLSDIDLFSPTHVTFLV
jgi:hypothetical protein